MRQVPAHYEYQQIIRTRLSSDAGKFPLLFVYTFFCNLGIGEEQSQEAAWMGTHEAPADTSMFGSVWVPPKGRGTGRQHRPAFFEDLKLRPGSAPSSL